MRCVVGIDLGSTTTKAVLLDEHGVLVGRGITNSRSNYEVACAIAQKEAWMAARFTILERMLEDHQDPSLRDLGEGLKEGFRLQLYLVQHAELANEIDSLLNAPHAAPYRNVLAGPAKEILDEGEHAASALFHGAAERKSDFFRDLAGASFMAGAERLTKSHNVPFERLVGLFDRAILNVESRPMDYDFGTLLRKAAGQLPTIVGGTNEALNTVVEQIVGTPIEEIAFVGTGYGRQTLPFPKEAVRSEILCHGRGAHRVFSNTRTVLDIGGQDTKAIQVDEHGVVTSFQMNDRCAAGCGRYLGYIADELNLGLHELGPLALRATKMTKVNSTCTVFAGAELRERLAMGQKREDILAGLHRAIMLRAMSLLARSGGVDNEFTFTGGVCKNPMATKILEDLVREHYGDQIHLNIHPDSIYMGALGGALFALDDVKAGKPGILPAFAARSGSTPMRAMV